MSKAMRSLGFGVIAADIVRQPWFDLNRPVIQSTLLGWISSGIAASVWLGTPCCTWSQARHGPPGSSWCRLRDAANLWGLSNLDPRASGACKRGNSQLRFSLRIVRACLRVGTPVALENPGSSWMWQVPSLQRLCRDRTSHNCTTDYCSFGARWRKRTRVQVWAPAFSLSLPPLCRGRGGGLQ